MRNQRDRGMAFLAIFLVVVICLCLFIFAMVATK